MRREHSNLIPLGDSSSGVAFSVAGAQASLPSPRLNFPPAWPAPQQATFLASGSGYDVWRVICPQGRGIWRQRRSGASPSILPQGAEEALLQQLTGQPWMPKLWAIAAQGQLCAEVQGERVDPARVTQAQRDRLIQTLLAVWRTPASSLHQWDYPVLIETYWQQAGRPDELEALKHQLQQQAASWSSRVCLIHQDLHLENLLLVDQRDWVLLDWEYGGLGNPWLDAVAVDRWLGWTPAERVQLEGVLAAYHPLGSQAWCLMSKWLHGLDQLWAAARLAQLSRVKTAPA
ncbi:phosphotransferase [Marinospirillum sp. MEB164]|uniref:Phosphotransferase n=1 Tax=Marinospirillum alkalitolerans TaxID=3123374 RepID=A0ABW8PUN9_9GAMM